MAALMFQLEVAFALLILIGVCVSLLDFETNALLFVTLMSTIGCLKILEKLCCAVLTVSKRMIKYLKRMGGLEVVVIGYEVVVRRHPPQWAKDKFKRFVELIIFRKRAATQMLARRNVLRMPVNLDGPAKGFAKHMGRWSWREVRSEW